MLVVSELAEALEADRKDRHAEWETYFRNGYKSLDKVPRFIIENKGITIGEGKAEWGCKSNDNFFIINHGEVLETFNIK
ncbi:MAG: hypothetical protein ACK5MH_08970 [Bacteroidales bacterium]